MTRAHAFAALALLLATASTASAASCSTATYDLGAISSSAPAVLSSNFAKCYGQLRIEVASDCKITVTSIAASGVSIPGLFGPGGDTTYTDYASW